MKVAGTCNSVLLLAVIATTMMTVAVSAFTTTPIVGGCVSRAQRPMKTKTMMMMPAATSVEAPPAAMVVDHALVALTLGQHQPSSPALQAGIGDYLSSAQSENDPMNSNTFMLSLKDRPPPPTAEELAAKKRNFNLWFWGGGFVAPFLATFYYFGFKFWEK